MGNQEMQWGELVLLYSKETRDERFAGQIMPRATAAIKTDALSSLGTLRGYAVSEIASALGPTVFHLGDHLERLWNSVFGLRIQLSMASSDSRNSSLLRKDIAKLLERNGFKSSLVWFRVDAGQSLADGFTQAGKPYLLIMVSEFDERFLCDQRGLAVKSIAASRQLPTVKCIADYALAEKKLAEYRPQGFDEVLYVSGHKEALTLTGKISELSRKNIFAVLENGTILTPPAKDVLAGVTRKIVVGLTRELSKKLVEREISLKELGRAKEIFATGTACGIVHIKKLDDRELELGPVTQELQKKFLKYREEYFKKHAPALV